MFGRKKPKAACACPADARSVVTRRGRKVCLADTPRGPRFVKQSCDVPSNETTPGVSSSPTVAADPPVAVTINCSASPVEGE